MGKLYRQFLALLGAVREPILQKLDEGMAEHGGLIFGVDALQPEGSCNLLYVLYEVLSESVVPAIQLLPLFLSPAGEQNCAEELLEIENQFRVAIRDAVNRPSLLQAFATDARGQVVPLRLYHGLRYRWKMFGADLLHCFEIPGLPPDNLKIDGCLDGYAAINGASAGGNPPSPYAILGSVRSASWPQAGNNSWRNCARYRCKLTRNTVNAWPWQKAHANFSPACIGIQLKPWASWRRVTQNAGLN